MSRFAVPAMLAIVGLLVAGCPDQPVPPDETPSAGSTSAAPTGQAMYFYPPQQGATLTFTNSGPAAGSTNGTVDSVSTSGGAETVTVTEVTTGSGQPVTVQRVFTTGADGSLTIDADGFLAAAPGLTVTAVGDDVQIPPIAELEAGKTGSGETFVEFSGALSGRNDVTYTVSGEGFSSVTVPAGKVDAYVVKLALDIKSSVAGTTSGTARYWFVPGFGLVRQETTIITATMVAELTKTSVPFS